jgi:hypothetical protein
MLQERGLAEVAAITLADKIVEPPITHLNQP